MKKDLRISARTKREVVATVAPTLEFHPFSDFISVKDPGKSSEMVKIGDILVPDATVAMGGYHIADVLEVGPGCVTVKKGDRIVCDKSQINPVIVKGQTFHTVREMQVMGRVNEVVQPKAD